MSVGDHCSRDVIVAYGDEPVRAAAQLMRQHHVGDVILVEDRGDRRFPVGIITDRDLVVEVLESGIDPDDVVLADLVTGPLLTLGEHEELADGLSRMRQHGVRHAPVVDETGVLIGVLAMDAVIELIAEEMTDLPGWSSANARASATRAAGIPGSRPDVRSHEFNECKSLHMDAHNNRIFVSRI